MRSHGASSPVPSGSPSNPASSSAGSDATSSGRLRVSTSQPSAARSSREPRPHETRPPRASPADAARSASTPASSPNGASAASTVAAAAVAGARGGPAGAPVSAMAPHAAHRRVGVTGPSVGSGPVDLHDLGALTGESAELMIAATSVLEQPEPLVVRLDDPARVDPEALAVLRRAPTVVVLVGEPAKVPPGLLDAVDVALTVVPDPPPPWHAAPVEPLAKRVAEQPLASVALASLLRVSERLPVWEAVAAEAATYGMLLGSDAYRRWLDGQGPAERPSGDGRPPVGATYRQDG